MSDLSPLTLRLLEADPELGATLLIEAFGAGSASWEGVPSDLIVENFAELDLSKREVIAAQLIIALARVLLTGDASIEVRNEILSCIDPYLRYSSRRQEAIQLADSIVASCGYGESSQDAVDALRILLDVHENRTVTFWQALWPRLDSRTLPIVFEGQLRLDAPTALTWLVSHTSATAAAQTILQYAPIIFSEHLPRTYSILSEILSREDISASPAYEGIVEYLDFAGLSELGSSKEPNEIAPAASAPVRVVAKPLPLRVGFCPHFADTTIPELLATNPYLEACLGNGVLPIPCALPWQKHSLEALRRGLVDVMVFNKKIAMDEDGERPQFAFLDAFAPTSHHLGGTFYLAHKESTTREIELLCKSLRAIERGADEDRRDYRSKLRKALKGCSILCGDADMLFQVKSLLRALDLRAVVHRPDTPSTEVLRTDVQITPFENPQAALNLFASSSRYSFFFGGQDQRLQLARSGAVFVADASALEALGLEVDTTLHTNTYVYLRGRESALAESLRVLEMMTLVVRSDLEGTSARRMLNDLIDCRVFALGGAQLHPRRERRRQKVTKVDEETANAARDQQISLRDTDPQVLEMSRFVRRTPQNSVLAQSGKWPAKSK